MTEFGFSIIVCCFNSEKRIGKTLEYLSKLELNSLLCEIILVDNNSRDRTVNIAKEKWASMNAPFDLKIVYEKKSGLTYARKKGIDFANFDYIIFCDDDNWLQENYLQVAFKYLQENTLIGILGGRSEAADKTILPDWFEKYQYCYAVGSPHLTDIDITEEGQIWGAGMVSRRNLLLQIFDEDFPFLCTDRKENNLSSGGDDEICMRVVLLGYRLFHVHELFFFHDINSERLTLEKLNSLFSGFRYSGYVHQRYKFCFSGIKGKGNFRLISLSLLKVVFNGIKLNFKNVRLQFDFLFFATGLKLFSDKEAKMIKLFWNKYKL